MASKSCNKEITSILSERKKCISVEVNSNQSFDKAKLLSIKPDFVGVTWIGNFKDQDPMEILPIKVAQEIISLDLIVLLHLPGRNLNKKSALCILNSIKDIGVRNILVLQGQYALTEEKDDTKVDFPYASHFVEFIKETFVDYFAIGVTGYPEKHSRSANVEEDMEYLKLKVSKGADFILTQGSFEYAAYNEFYERSKTYSIDVPIFIGAFPITSYNHLLILMKLCKISASNELCEFVKNHESDEELIQTFGLNRLLELSNKILDEKSSFAGIHIFSMNNLELVEKLLNKMNQT